MPPPSTEPEPPPDLDRLLLAGVRLGASDLHLTVASRPSYRVHGDLLPAPQDLGKAPLTQGAMEQLLAGITSERQRRELERGGHLDLGHTAAGGERFRLNFYREQSRLALAARHLDQGLLSLERLGLPAELAEVARLRAGLVLVTGSTGSGKSTTLATLLDLINRTRAGHILTVEDPVEFIHRPQRCIVHHRELGTDVPSFAAAVQASLREDPDVIMIGEMRDLDTMRAALTAAETGHLVFSTLHTAEAVGCVERLVGSFPGGEQEVARHRIGMALRAVIAQRLLRRADGEGRIAAVEILMVNAAAANLIEQGKTRQLFSMIESGAAEGMRTMDQSLAALVQQGALSRDEAFTQCKDRQTLERLLDRVVKLAAQAAQAAQDAHDARDAQDRPPRGLLRRRS